MKDIINYINESTFDIEKNIESAPDWEKVLIDFYKNNNGSVIRSVGVDCFGRKIEPGDWVIFMSPSEAGKCLSIGKVTGVKKNIQIALIIPRVGYRAGGFSDIQFISRPSQYVFKLNKPESLAAELA